MYSYEIRDNTYNTLCIVVSSEEEWLNISQASTEALRSSTFSKFLFIFSQVSFQRLKKILYMPTFIEVRSCL
jgi:hypothetical protein